MYIYICIHLYIYIYIYNIMYILDTNSGIIEDFVMQKFIFFVQFTIF